MKLDGCGAQVRRLPAAAPVHRHQRVRLLAAGGKDAARAMVLERASDEMDTVGEERGRERISGEAGQSAAVEGEAQPPAAIDAPARGSAEGGHGAASLAFRRVSASGFGSPAL